MESQAPRDARGATQASAPRAKPRSALSDALNLVQFSHSVFALPFALQAAWLAAGGLPPLRKLGWVVACCVAARTSAMAFNRFVDRRFDAQNPRTRARELPAGRMRASHAAAIAALSAVLFVLGARALNPLSGALALPVLAVLLGYSYVKRFSAWCHAVLGLALALAPLGAWVALRGTIDAQVWPVVWMAGGVLCWVAGFDLIYACQDRDFDRAHGLHSGPARLGVAGALRLARVLHAACLLLFALSARSAGLGPVYATALAAGAALLVWQHRLVRADDLSRVDRAFFTTNACFGLVLLAGMVLDGVLREAALA
jgi:4-hydroxybenzoate polyprenyltransferase